jgi:hypothetical protein
MTAFFMGKKLFESWLRCFTAGSLADVPVRSEPSCIGRREKYTVKLTVLSLVGRFATEAPRG